MANTYAANFGDVVKHAVLCEVILRERPQRYLESHGGRLVYDLAALTPGPGGVWDFLDVASGHDTLNRSIYAELIRRQAGTRLLPGKYPGSIALAAQHRTFIFRARHFVGHHEHVLAILAPVARLLPEL